MALSKKFLWVEVNRDRTPEIPKRFGVSAYPTLLTLGKKQEKVARFSGFKKPAAFVAELEDALRRHALYVAGKEWDEPNARPASITDEGNVQAFQAPAEDVPDGVTILDGAAWIAQGPQLFRVDLASGDVGATFTIPASVIDVCTDGKLLYAVEYGWTAGRPIHVLDPKNGKVLRSVVTEANRKNRAMGAKGVAWRDGKLYVLEGMRGVLHEVDPQNGEVTRRIETKEKWLAGLVFDGQHFVAGSRTALFWFDTEGRTMRKVAVNYPLRSVGHKDGAYYLMEQPVFGHDKEHKRVRVWPKRTLVYRFVPPP